MEQKGYKKSWKKSDKKPVVYKPKRGLNDGSGFMVQGEGLKYKQRRGPLSKLMTEVKDGKYEPIGEEDILK